LTDKGYTKAFNYLGVCYGTGSGVKKDPARGVEFLRAGSDAGDTRAMFNYANALMSADGVPADEAAALDLLKRASQRGNTDALFALGVAYQMGTLGCRKDDSTAVDLFAKAADRGHARAANRLGLCYLRGTGSVCNAAKAFQFFKLASDLGDSKGAFNVANAYDLGEGIAADNEKALEHYAKAAEGGDLEAMYRLGSKLIARVNTSGPDSEHERRSSPLDNARLPMPSQSEFAPSRSPQRVTLEDSGVVLLQLAAERGHTKAQVAMGVLYESSIFAAQDMATSMAYYRQAAKEHDPEATAALRRLLMHTLPDSFKALHKKEQERYVGYLVEGGTTPWSKAKIVVLGREGVGKTHLLARIRGLSQYQDVSTDGIEIHKFLTKDGFEICWFDFGGQAIFYPTHQFFLSSQCVYMLCFSFADEQSIESCTYWLKSIHFLARHPAKPSKILLVGTHADVCSDATAQRKLWDRLFPFIEQNGHVVATVGVSCTSGEGVEAVMQGIEMAVDAAKLRTVSVPKSFLVIERWIADRPATQALVSYKELVAEFPSIDPFQIDRACEFLNDMGQCVYDKELELLVANPAWLADTFSSLISFSSGWIKDGLVASSSLEHVWKGLKLEEIDKLMGLLGRFGIAMPRKDRMQWIVPCLLPETPPAQSPEFSPAPDKLLFMRVFKFDSIVPTGLLGRLITRLQERAESCGYKVKHFWRFGIVLLSPAGDTAEVLEKPEPPQIQCRFVCRVSNFLIQKDPLRAPGHTKSAEWYSPPVRPVKEAAVPSNQPLRANVAVASHRQTSGVKLAHSALDASPMEAPSLPLRAQNVWRKAALRPRSTAGATLGPQKELEEPALRGSGRALPARLSSTEAMQPVGRPLLALRRSGEAPGSPGMRDLLPPPPSTSSSTNKNDMAPAISEPPTSLLRRAPTVDDKKSLAGQAAVVRKRAPPIRSASVASMQAPGVPGRGGRSQVDALSAPNPGEMDSEKGSAAFFVTQAKQTGNHGLLRMVVEEFNGLLSALFAKAFEKPYGQYVACPHCLGDPELVEEPVRATVFLSLFGRCVLNVLCVLCHVLCVGSVL
jgi:TPR repeat protein